MLYGIFFLIGSSSSEFPTYCFFGEFAFIENILNMFSICQVLVIINLNIVGNNGLGSRPDWLNFACRYMIFPWIFVPSTTPYPAAFNAGSICSALVSASFIMINFNHLGDANQFLEYCVDNCRPQIIYHVYQPSKYVQSSGPSSQDS